MRVKKNIKNHTMWHNWLKNNQYKIYRIFSYTKYAMRNIASANENEFGTNPCVKIPQWQNSTGRYETRSNVIKLRIILPMCIVKGKRFRFAPTNSSLLLCDRICHYACSSPKPLIKKKGSGL